MGNPLGVNCSRVVRFIKAGQPGDDAVVYYLTSNVSSISSNSAGVPKDSDASVVVSVWKKQGQQSPVLTQEVKLALYTVLDGVKTVFGQSDCAPQFSFVAGMIEGKDYILAECIDKTTSRVIDSLTIANVRDGNKGDDAVTYRINVVGNIVINGYGIRQSRSTVGIFFYIIEGSTQRAITSDDNCTFSILRYDQSGQSSDVVTTTQAGGSYSLSIPSAFGTDYVNYRVNLNHNGNVVAEANIPVVYNGVGGRIPIPDGEYDSTKSYTATDKIAPLVLCEGEFYVMAKTTTWAAGAGSPKTDYATYGQNATWIYCERFTVIMTQLLMAQLGLIGKAVFWEQFMYSQYGTVNGVATQSYGQPVQAGGTFDPNLLMNFLTGYFKCNNVDIVGKVTATEGTFTGTVNANSGTFNGTLKANLFYASVKVVTATYTIDPATEPYTTFVYNELSGRKFLYLPLAASYDGMEITVFIKNTNGDVSIVDNYVRISRKAGSSDVIYIQQNIAIVKQSDTYYANPVNVPTRDYGATYYGISSSSILLIANTKYVFKSMLGAWYAIEGMFTGE